VDKERYIGTMVQKLEYTLVRGAMAPICNYYSHMESYARLLANSFIPIHVKINVTTLMDTRGAYIV
jgi:hypothetical protein